MIALTERMVQVEPERHDRSAAYDVSVGSMTSHLPGSRFPPRYFTRLGVTVLTALGLLGYHSHPGE